MSASDNKLIAKLAVGSFSEGVEKKLTQISPQYRNCDIVISTYPLIHPQKGKLTMMLVPDPTVHCTYVAKPAPDYYLAWWPECVSALLSLGVSESKILPFGPFGRPSFYEVGSKINSSSDKAQFKKQLGIPAGSTLGLVTAGSNWIDRCKEYMVDLYDFVTSENITLAFICGKNHKFARAMREKYAGCHNFIFLEWLASSEMATWMGAADFALAFSLAQMTVEAGLTRVPLFVLKLIEGQEEGYKEVVENNNCGVVITGSPEEQVKYLQENLINFLKSSQEDMVSWQKYLLNVPDRCRTLLTEITNRTPSK